MDAIRELRLRQGWSQEGLARRAGLTVNTISNIESGRHRPFPSTLRKIAAALDCEVPELFGEEPRPKAEAPKSPLEHIEELRRTGKIEVAVEADDPNVNISLENLSEPALTKVLNEVEKLPQDAMMNVYVPVQTVESEGPVWALVSAVPRVDLRPEAGV